MRRMKDKTRFIKYIFFMVIIQIFLLTAPIKGMAESNRFSFEFKQCSVPEALHQISQGGGITISAPFEVLKNNKVNKSYKNSKIENIIADMFHEQSYAIIWNYQNDRLVHVDIRLAASDTSKHLLKGTVSDNSTLRKYQSDNHSVTQYQADNIQPVARPYSTRDLSNDKRNDTSGPPPPDPERFKGLELPPMPSGILQPNLLNN